MKQRKVPRTCKPMNKQGKLIAIMAVVIIVLAIAVVYSFALRPAFNGYVVEKQMEAQDIVLNALLSQLQQNGYIQIPFGDEVLTLVPYQPPVEQQEIVE
ncbi:MAG: hypothetical protein ABFQ65_04345 [Nanoarchaeota archaeon]